MAQKEEDGGGTLSSWSLVCEGNGVQEGMWALELSNLDLSLGSASSRHRALDKLLNLIFSLSLTSELERADPVCVPV